MPMETIDQYFVQQYRNTIILLSQQQKSRLEETTMPPIDVQGEYFYWERMGPAEAIDLVTRHSDTPNIEVEHSRRRASAVPKVWATLLDRIDQVRMLVDPLNPYNQIAKMAMGRAKDRIIINALGGSAWAGKNGTVEVPLPASQIIVHGSAGLTVSKLLTAKRILDQADVDEDVPRYCVVTSQQVTNLLNTTEVTSADYNTVRTLVEGKIDTFLGFKFIRTELLPKTGSTRSCYVYAKGAIGFGILENITARVDQRSDKNYAWQVYVSMDMGATRIEEAQVVEVQCTET